MLFYTVQESKDSISLASLASSIAMTNRGSDLCILCTKEAQKNIKELEIEGINLIFLEAPHELTMKGFIQNWIYITEHIVNIYNEGLFVNSQMVICGTVTITPEIEKQQFGFILDEFSKDKYSFCIFYIASTEVVTKLNEFFIAESKLIENDKEVLKIWFEFPKQLADYDDGKLCANSFFDGRCIISTTHFISNKGWDHTKVTTSPLSYENTPIFIASIIKNQKFANANLFILQTLLKSNDAFLPIIELFSYNKIHVYAPTLEGIAHWDRTDDPSLNQLWDTLPNFETKPQNTNHDYFECAKYVLYDKPSIKCLTNYLNHTRGVIYYDYDNEMIDFWKTFDKPAIFGGYIVPYHAVLDDFVVEEAGKKSGSVSSSELPTSFESEHDYNEHLAKLVQYETCEFDSSTPKYRISECLKLGVKLVVVDETTLLDSDKFDTEYYKTTLSLSGMRSKLLKTIFSNGLK